MPPVQTTMAAAGISPDCVRAVVIQRLIFPCDDCALPTRTSSRAAPARISTPSRSIHFSSAATTSAALPDEGNTLPSSSACVGTSRRWSSSRRSPLKNRAKAGWRNRPLRPKADMNSSLSHVFVRLHRPPPLARILHPGRGFFSKRMTLRPRSRACPAAIKPAAPAPATMTGFKGMSFACVVAYFAACLILTPR